MVRGGELVGGEGEELGVGGWWEESVRGGELMEGEGEGWGVGGWRG